MPAPRRIVATTVDGASRVASDGTPPIELGEVEGYGPMLSVLWQTDMAPAHTQAGADPTPETFTQLPEHGVFRALRLVIGPGGEIPMHHTETIDVIYIAEGKADLVLQRGPVPVAAGDVVVLQGDEHGWQNPHGEACVIIGSMLGAPLPS